LLIGDGSGSDWSQGAGAGVVVIDRDSMQPKALWLGASAGTVTLAEMMPYIWGMVWYTSKDGPGKRRRKAASDAGRQLAIHAVTDSTTVATVGGRPDSRKTHKELWTVMDAFARTGYPVQWHHVKRDIINLNILVDQLSRRARLDVEGTFQRAIDDLHKTYGVPADAKVHDFL
jgi:hypothetical protein